MNASTSMRGGQENYELGRGEVEDNQKAPQSLQSAWRRSSRPEDKGRPVKDN